MASLIKEWSTPTKDEYLRVLKFYCLYTLQEKYKKCYTENNIINPQDYLDLIMNRIRVTTSNSILTSLEELEHYLINNVDFTNFIAAPAYELLISLIENK